MSAPIPYMPLHIGEYLADAAHLSTIEHGAYLLLIMNYWQRGEALPADDRKLARIARMSDAEWADARESLVEFFTEADGRWSHKRIEQELATARDKIEKKRNAGKASANSRSTDAQQALNDKIREDEKSSEADASGGEAPPVDPKKVLFDAGVALLTAQGDSEKQARSFIGKLAKEHGGPRTMEVLTAAVADGKADAKSWMVSQLRTEELPAATDNETALVEWAAARFPRMRPAERLAWARDVLKPLADLRADAVRRGIRDALGEKPQFMNQVADMVASKAREWARLDARALAKPKPPAPPPADAAVTAEQMANLRQSIGKLGEQMRAA